MPHYLPPLPSLTVIQSRLNEIFPEGSEFRNYRTRDIAVKTVFVMLYIGAIEEAGCFLAPKHVCKMSDAQATSTSDAQRYWFATECIRAKFVASGTPWYADNTREPIRDETLRQGLIPVGAVVERRDLPTTSPKPRYALRRPFAELFNPQLKGRKLTPALHNLRS